MKILCCSLLAACVVGVAESRVLQITNGITPAYGPNTIVYLHMRPSCTADWGEEILAGRTLGQWQYLQLELDGGIWDVGAVDQYGREYYVLGIPLISDYNIDITSMYFGQGITPPVLSIGTEAVQPAWVHEVDGEVFRGLTLRGTMLFCPCLDGNLYSLDAITGSENWRFGSAGSIVASPAFMDGRVYFGSRDSTIYCLEEVTGNLVWSKDIGGEVLSSLACSDTRVFCANVNGVVSCVSSVDGSLLWAVDTDAVIYAPLITSDSLLFACCNDGRVLCLRSADGIQEWQYETNATLEAGVLAADEVVYVPTIGSSSVICLDLHSGMPVWETKLEGGIYMVPTLFRNSLFVGCADGNIYCLDALSGSTQWEFATAGQVSAEPIIANGRLYATSWDGYVYCLNPSSGEPIWGYPTGASIYSHAVVDRGIVYAAGAGRTVFCLLEQTAPSIGIFLEQSQ
jgi:outer membrane protein assembly factor BamB